MTVSDEPRTIAEIEADIQRTNEQYNSLKLRLASLKEEVASVEEGMRAIKSPYRRNAGRLHELLRELNHAKLLKKQDIATRVVWVGGEGRNELAGEHIVSRVTKKRIYVQKIGSQHETYYLKDSGKPDGRWRYNPSQIDIEATFGPDWDGESK